jgi:peroxiredoxin
MNALRVTPPASAPDVAFQALDGRQARLATLRGLPVLLTFFTTW